ELEGVRHDVPPGAALRERDGRHLAIDETRSDLDVARFLGAELGEEGARLRDGVLALPGTRRVRGAPAEGDLRVEAAEAAEVHLAVGRLEAEGERDLLHPRASVEDGLEAVRGVRALL